MPATSSKTLATLLTPLARGAIATVAVRGSIAVEVSDRYFISLGKVRLNDAETGKILVGHWQAAGEELGEELVVAKLDEMTVEIHCHGGIQASRRILGHLEAEGCEICSWQDWTWKHESEAIIAEAKIALPEAATEQAALHLLDQCQGAFSREVEAILESVEASNFEVGLQRIDKILAFASFGRHLTRPWSIVLAGPPNVGKSSLLNKIVGYDRAIVLDMPGTTRDVLHATTALDGWPVQFSDTAGIRLSSDELEQAGIAKAKEALQSADLVVVLHDATDLRPHELDDSLRELPSALHVVNKIDLASDIKLPDSREMLVTSAVTGQGVPELISAIVGHLVKEIPEAGQAIPFLDRHVIALRKAAERLRNHQMEGAIEALQTLIYPPSLDLS